MSRIRSVHPGFFKDDRLVPCSPFARLLFIGLGVEADDKGVFEWKPVTLKMNIFPGDNIDMVALLEELVVAEAIRQYEIDGRKYGAIRNFRKFQKPKTPNDTHPATDEIRNYVGLSAANSETDEADAEPFPQNGEKSFQMEDGGGKREKDAKPTASLGATRWAKGRKVPDDWKVWAKTCFPTTEAYRITTETRQFEEYWPSKVGKDGLRGDWEAEFHMWMRRKFGADEIDPDAAGAADLVVIGPDDDDFKLVETVRGKPLVLGKSGKTTISKAEIARAREISGMVAH